MAINTACYGWHTRCGWDLGRHRRCPRPPTGQTKNEHPTTTPQSATRATLSEQVIAAADGSGPKDGFAFGETEDLLLGHVLQPIAVEPPPAVEVLGFTPVEPQGGFPEEIATGSGTLEEVDVAYVGGAGSQPRMVVAAVGTGAVGRLASFGTTGVGDAFTYRVRVAALGMARCADGLLVNDAGTAPAPPSNAATGFRGTL